MLVLHLFFDQVVFVVRAFALFRISAIYPFSNHLRIVFKRHSQDFFDQRNCARLYVSAILINLIDLNVLFSNAPVERKLFLCIDLTLLRGSTGKELLDLVQREIQLLELLDQRKGLDLFLALVAITRSVVHVVGAQHADLVVITQSSCVDLAQFCKFSDFQHKFHLFLLMYCGTSSL